MAAMGSTLVSTKGGGGHLDCHLDCRRAGGGCRLARPRRRSALRRGVHARRRPLSCSPGCGRIVHTTLDLDRARMRRPRRPRFHSRVHGLHRLGRLGGGRTGHPTHGARRRVSIGGFRSDARSSRGPWRRLGARAYRNFPRRRRDILRGSRGPLAHGGRMDRGGDLGRKSDSALPVGRYRRRLPAGGMGAAVGPVRPRRRWPGHGRGASGWRLAARCSRPVRKRGRMGRTGGGRAVDRHRDGSRTYGGPGRGRGRQGRIVAKLAGKRLARLGPDRARSRGARRPSRSPLCLSPLKRRWANLRSHRPWGNPPT